MSRIATQLIEAALLAAYKQSRNMGGKSATVYRLTVADTQGGIALYYFAQPSEPAATLNDAKAALGGRMKGDARVTPIAVITVILEGMLLERPEQAASSPETFNRPLGAC